MILPINSQNKTENKIYDINVPDVIERVRTHDFNPLNEDNSMTLDRSLNVAGIADLNNNDWQVRLLAVRDLVRVGDNNVKEVIAGLTDKSAHVRQVCAMALGILRSKDAISSLEQLVRQDENTMVRSQAVIALGQIEAGSSLALLHETLKTDPSRDVQHQCDLAIYQIEKQLGTTDKQLSAFLALDESTFNSVYSGSLAPEFRLDDTDGNEWKLSQFRNEKWVVLIWVFADWCPVCHGEFQDLMEMQDEFDNAGVQVFTLEMHDRYQGRVMVGKELDPSYWFSKKSFHEAYTERIWWPHLLDRAGAIGAMYGADPLAFAVHAEYINRPTTVIIDKEGIVRLNYQGTFWGDRPTIEQTLKMIETGDFSFEHPQRLSVNN
ncbi:MAG: redoxin domain-containing protein [Bacteroidales bacterium]|nr:redoxin domain-containing protein [Bacteroidales bacterium]MDT8374249.1 redoxin domain-containing protein [Bacteroidales bacterium]